MPFTLHVERHVGDDAASMLAWRYVIVYIVAIAALRRVTVIRRYHYYYVHEMLPLLSMRTHTPRRHATRAQDD